MSFVEINDVWMRYSGAGGTLALRNTTMNVDKSEFVAVVGPSGCGKSTLMRLVTGLWPTSAGTVSVAGKDVDRPLSIAGMAFQNPTLLPWRTVLGNVMLPFEVVAPHASNLKQDRKIYEKKCKDLLELVGLKGFENKNPWQLSGGMQQRASLCRALVHEPQLLMLDEPFAALDVFTREDLWGVLQNLWMVRRPTVILVTHDLREATFLADRVLIMTARPGRIMVERKIDLPRPRTTQTTYTQQFQEIVQDLRENIDLARKGEEIAHVQ
jgi:NitT/TauT family transport system ATP-binding protein